MPEMEAVCVYPWQRNNPKRIRVRYIFLLRSKGGALAFMVERQDNNNILYWKPGGK
jgi:hypothetical protein